MSLLPPKLHEKALNQFDILIEQAPKIASMMRSYSEQHNGAGGIWHAGGLYAQGTEYFSFLMQCESLVRLVLGNSQRANDLINLIQSLQKRPSSVEQIQGYLVGIKSDYEAELLTNVHDMIASNIDVDYLVYAEQLLSEGKIDNFDHVPAAVLAGAILENSLRRLCSQQNPVISLVKPNNQNKNMGMLIEDLKKSGLFNEAKAKKLRAWAAIRNAAAHGKFSEFTRKDTEEMIKGIENFLADFL